VFNRVVSPALLDSLRPGGPFANLLDLRREHADRVDLQLRRDQRGPGRDQPGTLSWVSLIVGLTSILDLEEQGGKFRVRAHRTHRERGGFDDLWALWRPREALAADWPAVTEYVMCLLAPGGVDRRYWGREGNLQTAIASGHSLLYGCVQREAVLSFPNDAVQKEIEEPIRRGVVDPITTCSRTEAWWPGVRDGRSIPRAGNELDAIGCDMAGNLLAIEVKPFDEIKGITWGPAQVQMYVELLSRLLDLDPLAIEVLNKMAEQRTQLGLLDSRWQFASADRIRIVPVLALGAGRLSPKASGRLAAVAQVLHGRRVTTPRVDPLQVWQIDELGNPVTVWTPSTGEASPFDQI
jgi:hypothetical protein